MNVSQFRSLVGQMADRPTAEGKTKGVYPHKGDSGLVFIRNRDGITIGDGAHGWTIPGKGVIVTAINTRIMTLLNAAGLSTHFICQVDPDTFLAKRAVTKFLLEIVVRHEAQRGSSYLRRHPGIPEGTVFDSAIVELFWKDDASHDALIHWNPERGAFELHKAKMPFGEGYIQDFNPDLATMPADETEFAAVFQLAGQAADLVRRTFRVYSYNIPDGKIEVGRDAEGNVMIIDVYDCESFRISNPSGVEISKEVLRQRITSGQRVTPAFLRRVLANYAEVAAISAFLQLPI